MPFSGQTGVRNEEFLLACQKQFLENRNQTKDDVWILSEIFRIADL